MMALSSRNALAMVTSLTPESSRLLAPAAYLSLFDLADLFSAREREALMWRAQYVTDSVDGLGVKAGPFLNPGGAQW